MGTENDLPPLDDDDPATDADNNIIVKNAIDKAIDDDPTRFISRSFAVIWNEGHSIRLINRHDARQAISIPWDEIEALQNILKG